MKSAGKFCLFSFRGIYSPPSRAQCCSHLAKISCFSMTPLLNEESVIIPPPYILHSRAALRRGGGAKVSTSSSWSFFFRETSLCKSQLPLFILFLGQQRVNWQRTEIGVICEQEPEVKSLVSCFWAARFVRERGNWLSYLHTFQLGIDLTNPNEHNETPRKRSNWTDAAVLADGQTYGRWLVVHSKKPFVRESVAGQDRPRNGTYSNGQSSGRISRGADRKRRPREAQEDGHSEWGGSERGGCETERGQRIERTLERIRGHTVGRRETFSQPPWSTDWILFLIIKMRMIIILRWRTQVFASRS